MYQPVKVPNVNCYAGDVAILGRATFLLDEDGEQTPYNLGEWTEWKAHWRPRKTSDEFLDLVVTVEPEEGILTVQATPDVTQSMGRKGVWDVQSKRGDEVRTWLQGTTTREMDVTR